MTLPELVESDVTLSIEIVMYVYVNLNCRGLDD